jgi:CzcA family heavy metal efflux pump
MLRSVVDASLRFRYLMVLVALALLAVGTFQLRDTYIDLLPEFSRPEVEVQTEALGLAAAEVEALITVPLEEMLSGLPWLETAHSKSITGLSSVLMTFEPGTDVMDARQMVQERLLHTLALPKVSKRPAMLQPVSTTNRVLKVGLSSSTLSLIDLSVLARWKIKPRVLGVPGVANVAIWGQRERQLQIQVDPARLQEKNVRLADVIRASGDALWSSPLSFLQASTPGNGGFIDMPNQRMDVRHVLPILSPQDLASVTFRTSEGAMLRLGDVADVVQGHPPMIGDGIVNDQPGLLLVVEKFPGANTGEVTEGVEAALAALRPGLPGVEIDTTIFRPATFLALSVDNLRVTLLIGSVLGIVALLALLYDWRAAVVGVVAIPLSLMAAVLVFQFYGIAINAMILAGLILAVGVVVDDAIVATTGIARRLRENHGAAEPCPAAQVILQSSIETRRATGYATLIMLLVLAPVLFLDGLEGAFFGPLAISCALALLGSMAVALTVTPALSLILWAGALPPDPPLQRWLQNRYKGALAGIAAAPRVVLTGSAAILLLGLALLPLLRPSLLPAFQERDFVLRWSSEPGISYTEISRLVGEASQKLREVPGVRNVGAQVGRAVMSDQVADINAAEIWVGLDPGADYDETVAAIQQVAALYPGLSSEPLSFATLKIREMLTGSAEPVVVRLYGPDHEVLRGKAEEVSQALSRIDGIVAPRVDAKVDAPQIEIEVSLAAAEQYGIKPGDVRREATTLVAGIEVGNLFEEQKVFEVVVWGTPAIRDDIESIRELPIGTPDGGSVRLADVADVRLVTAQNVFERTGASRSIDISAGIAGRDLGLILEDVDDALEEIQFPLEHHAELLDDYLNEEEAETRFLAYAVAAALGIFLLLQAALRSWRLASLMFLLLPSALVGGVVAALAAGGTASLGVVAGFLMVLGLAVRSAVLLIQRYQELEEHDGQQLGTALVIHGAMERVGPVVATAMVVALMMLPLALRGGIPGLEIVHPMAVVILGGLVTSTLFVLFVVPALYAAFRTQPEPEFDGRMHHAVS